MKMRFVKINEANFPLAKLLEVLLKSLHVSLSFHRIRLGEHFLALFPTQAVRLEDVAQQVATHLALIDLFDPTPHFFQAPAVAWQAMFDGFRLAHGRDKLVDLFLAKKGVRPPVLR